MSTPEVEQLWELQGQQAQLRRHVLQLTSQLNVAARERGILDITIREMDSMNNQTKVYMAIGKMFALNPKDELKTQLIETRNESMKKDEDRKKLRDKFVARLRDSENRIDELACQIDQSRAKKRDTNVIQ